jgi:flavin reductase (DIM6/NTAB) family NADH-FMN oxidoreductase RutF
MRPAADRPYQDAARETSRPSHAFPGGDHEIVVGRVRHVESNGDGAAPLPFRRGRYTSIEGQFPG